MASRAYLRIRKAAFGLLDTTPDCRLEFLAGFLYRELLQAATSPDLVNPELARVMAVRTVEDWRRLRGKVAAT